MSVSVADMTSLDTPRKRAVRIANDVQKATATKADELITDFNLPKAKRARKSKSTKSITAQNVPATPLHEKTDELSWTNQVEEDVDNKNPTASATTSTPTFVLSPSAQILLDDLDLVNQGFLDEEDLGRSIRLSHLRQICITDTIKACLAVNTVDSKSLTARFQIINSMNQITQISRSTNMTKAFPFDKLPSEIRRMIYKLALHNPAFKVIYVHKACRVHKPTDRTWLPRNFRALLFTNKKIYKEALPIYYQTNCFEFACTGALSHFLSVCRLDTLSSIESLRFNWIGLHRSLGIGRLATLINLKHLTITVEYGTSTVPSEREDELRNLFYPNQTLATLRLIDCAGFDELIKLRGLTSVSVVQSRDCKRSTRKNREAETLERFLNTKLLLARTPTAPASLQ